MSNNLFKQWIELTFGDWIQVNASYFIDRNMKVAQDSSRLYITPVTSKFGAGLVLSNDHCVKTVMGYIIDNTPEFNAKYSSVAVPDLTANDDEELNGIYFNALRRAFSDGFLPVDKSVSKMLGIQAGGPCQIDALKAFSDRSLSLDNLRRVLSTSYARQKSVLEKLAIQEDRSGSPNNDLA
jgi:hypothetical protein